MQRGHTNKVSFSDLADNPFAAFLMRRWSRRKRRVAGRTLIYREKVTPRSHNAHPPKLVSLGAGCMLKNMRQYNEKYSHLGVRWRKSKMVPGAAEAVFDDLHAKRRALRALQIHDNDDYAT
jgi:hypothetical protein